MKQVNRSLKEVEKLHSEFTNKIAKKCPKCGHTLGFTTQGLERVTCTWCGELVFKSEKAKYDWELKKFKNQLKKEMKKYHIYNFADITLGEMYKYEDKISEIDWENKLITIVED